MPLSNTSLQCLSISLYLSVLTSSASMLYLPTKPSYVPPYHLSVPYLLASLRRLLTLLSWLCLSIMTFTSTCSISVLSSYFIVFYPFNQYHVHFEWKYLLYDTHQIFHHIFSKIYTFNVPNLDDWCTFLPEPNSIQFEVLGWVSVLGITTPSKPKLIAQLAWW